MRNGSAPRRALVAGAAGFIGSHLCDALLSRGIGVLAIDNFQTGTPANLAHHAGRSDLTLLHRDIIDPLPLSARADVIYNLACAASPPHYQADPVHTLMTSVLGTRNLLALAADTGARLVLASTSEVYGDPDVHPQPEAYFGNVNPTGPRACYDEGKRAAETLAFDYLRTGRADVRVARIFNTYGPRIRADDGRVISNMIVQALSSADVTVYGDGTQTRSFCYVEDLVAGLVALADVEGPVTSPVNLGNPVEIAVMDLAERIIAETGSRSRIVRCPLPPDDPRRRKPDIRLARALLGWHPKVSFSKGLSETIAWFEADTQTSPRTSPRRGQNRNGSRAASAV